LNLTQNEILIGLIILAAIIYFWKAQRPDADGRYADSAVNVSLVESIILDEFELKKDERLKFGYTEKTIEKQLEKVFQERFQHIVTQYGLDGPSGQKIDFDIGHGKVGVEIKLANAVFKAAGQDRMVGQVQSYVQSKYNDDNLLLVIFCEAEHIAQRVMIKSIESRLVDMSVNVLFVEINIVFSFIAPIP